MADPFRIRVVVAVNGERLPLLLDAATGIPLFEPTVYVLTMLRARNAAANTIVHHLKAIKALLLFARARGIDPIDRIRSGRYFDLHEIDALAAALYAPIDALVEGAGPQDEPCPVPHRTRVVRLEAVRTRLSPSARAKRIDRATAANRLRAIRDYLKWLASRHIARLAEDAPRFEHHRAKSDALEQGLTARIPRAAKHGRALPEGMETGEAARLREAVMPAAHGNPWRDPRVKARNQVLVKALDDLGLRLGELLGLRVEDINFQAGKLKVVRRPDAADDPRREQPTAKTSARDLPLSPELAELLYDYVVNVRAKTPNARKHGFLFVNARNGAPLSVSAVDKIFRQLRLTIGAGGKLSAHILRHTWNDRFSALAERSKMKPEQEERLRSYLMGWRDGSGTAATYTRRYVRHKANEVSLAMQRAAFVREDGHGQA